jgi:hypothetical protein
VAVKLATAQAETLSSDIATIIAAVYEGSVAPVEAESVDGADEVVEGITTGDDPGDVVAAVSEEVSLSATAEVQVEALAAELQAAEENTLEVPGVHEDETVSVEVAPGDVTASTDTQTGELVLSVTTIVNEVYDTGVIGESLVESLATISSTGEVTSFATLSEEDYAEAALLDSNAQPASPDDGLGSEAGVAVELASAEQSAYEGGGLTATPAVFRSGHSTAVMAGMTAANKQKVVDYALKYALSYNKDYRSFSQDCTNFVSQAMRAGGWSYDYWPLGYTADGHWWYNAITQTYTWAGAEKWYRFARNESGRATVLTKVADLKPGDVLQIKFKGQSEIGHSMIVTKKVGSSIYLSYHTSDNKNKALSDVLKAYPTATYFAHRI